MLYKSAVLLLNPNSRSGKGETIDQCIKVLRASGISLRVIESKSAVDARYQIQQLAESVELIIVAGGDGTIHNLIPVLRKKNIPFAILPMGTANDLARSLYLPLDPIETCEVILSGRVGIIDIARINSKFFFNVAHLGLGVHVTHKLTSENKKKWGVFGYLHAFIKSLAQLKSFRVEVNADGQIYKMRALHCSVGNGRYYGGGNIVDQSCFIDDGQLSLFILKPQTLWDLLTLAPFLRAGAQAMAKKTFTVKAEMISIKTSKSMEIDADGEPIAHTPAEFKVLPKSLRVVCAEEFFQDRSTNDVVREFMSWLKSDEEVFINDVLIALRKSEDYYLQASLNVNDASARELLSGIARMRKFIAEAIESYLENKGRLPVTPDQDAEWGGLVISNLLAKVSASEDKCILQQRIRAEQSLLDLVSHAKSFLISTIPKLKYTVH